MLAGTKWNNECYFVLLCDKEQRNSLPRLTSPFMAARLTLGSERVACSCELCVGEGCRWEKYRLDVSQVTDIVKIYPEMLFKSNKLFFAIAKC